MQNISLEQKIEQKYKVKALYKNQMVVKSFLMPTKRFAGGSYFEDPKIENIYQRCLKIIHSVLMRENRKNEKELEKAFLNKDIEVFLKTLSENRITIKRSYLEKYSRLNNYDFKVLDFTNNSSWSFSLDNSKYLVAYNKIKKGDRDEEVQEIWKQNKSHRIR